MAVKHDQDEMASRRRSERRGRPHAEKRVGAREIVRAVEWLEFPQVYWAGGSIDGAANPVAGDWRSALRSFTQVVAARFHGLPAGPYAVAISSTSGVSAEPSKASDASIEALLVPVIREAIPIDRQLIQKTVRALEAAKRYPKALPKVVGDADDWRHRMGRLLGEASQGLRELDVAPHRRAPCLAAEGFFLWIGDGADRPSRKASDAEVLAAITGEESAQRTRELAAVVSGARRLNPARLPRDLQRLAALGRALSQWPPDVILAVDRASGSRERLGVAQEHLTADSEEFAHAVLELLLLSPRAAVADAIPDLLEVVASVRRAIDEWEIRRTLLAAMIRTIGEDWSYRPPKWRFADAEARLQIGRDFSQAAHQRLAFTWEGQPIVGHNGAGSWTVSIDECCLYLVGHRLSNAEQRSLTRRSWGALAADVVRIKTAGWANPQEALRSWVPLLLSLVVRIGRLGGSTGLGARLAEWIDHCRWVCPPGKSGTASIGLALSTALNAVDKAAGDADRISRALESLARHGLNMISREVSRCWRHNRSRTFPDVEPADLIERLVDRCGVLESLSSKSLASEELMGTVVGLGLWSEVADLDASRPEAVVPFLRWASQSTERVGVDRTRRLVRCGCDTLFCAFAASDLSSVLGWVSDSRFSADDQEEFLEKMAEFVWDGSNLTTEEGRAADCERRARFIAENTWLLEDALRTEQNLENLAERRAETRGRQLTFWCGGFLEFVYHFWRGNHCSIEKVADTTLRFIESHGHPEFLFGLVQGLSVPEVPFLVSLVGDRVERIPPLIMASSSARRFPVRPSEAWDYLARFDGIQRFLQECIDRPALTPRVCRFLERVALTMRLKSEAELTRGFEKWIAPTVNTESPLSNFQPACVRSELLLLGAYRRMAGMSDDLPSDIDRALSLESSVQREVTALQERPSIPGRAAKRLRNLQRLLDDPSALAERVASDLARLVPKHMLLAKFAAMESIASTAMQQHWEKVLGRLDPMPDDADWQNALLIYSTIKKNRRLMRQILQHEVSGEDERPRAWILRHPENQRFLKRLKGSGLNVDAWLEERESILETPTGPLIAYTEHRPLKVLQMGNLFGTCLGTFNAFAAVANAVEVNKKVLYLRDRSDRILGRKLVALTAEGVLYGFESYGAARGEHPWVKIVFDLLCARIADASGAKLATEEECTLLDERGHKPLELFCQWYSDLTETFDWWVMKKHHDLDSMDNHESVWAELQEELADASGHDARRSLLRSILVLGGPLGGGKPPVDGVSAALDEDEVAFLRQHSGKGHLRDWFETAVPHDSHCESRPKGAPSLRRSCR